MKTLPYNYASGKRGGPSRRLQGLFIPAIIILMVVIFYYLTFHGRLSFSTDMLTGLTLGMFVYILTFNDPRAGLLITLLAIGISPEYSTGGISLRLEDFIIPAAFFAWLTKLIVNSEKLTASPWNVPLAIFLFQGALATFIGLSWEELSFRTAVAHYGKQIEYALLFLMIVNNVRTEKELKAFAICIFICSAIASFIAFRQSLGYTGASGGSEYYRVTGPKGETANILGGYLLFHIILAVGFFPYLKTIRMRIVLLLYLGFLGVPMLYTLSRSSCISLVAGLLFIGLFRKRRILLLTLLGVAAMPVLLPTHIMERLSSIQGIFTGHAPSSWEAKTVIWKNITPDILTSPLFGHGFGSIPLGDVDSEYFKVGYESGLLGLVLFIALIVIAVKIALQVSKYSENRWYKAYALGYLGGSVGLLVHSIAATTLTAIRTAETYYFATGLLMAIYAMEQVNMSARIRQDERDTEAWPSSHTGTEPSTPNHPSANASDGTPA